MKKVLVSVFALAALAACGGSYDYYQGGVQYTQDGEDCVYTMGERGRHFNNDIYDMNNGKKIVYRNTRCADLYARDNLGQAPRHDRQAIVPAAKPAPCNACQAHAPKCGEPVLKRRYVIVAQ